MNRDSGQFRGQRTTGGGRVRVRNALYMPMLTAIRCNPVIRRFYQRLVDHGKTKMTALVAAMRKLLTLRRGVSCLRERATGRPRLPDRRNPPLRRR